MCIRPALSLHLFHHGDLLQQLGNHLSLRPSLTPLSPAPLHSSPPLSLTPPSPLSFYPSDVGINPSSAGAGECSLRRLGATSAHLLPPCRGAGRVAAAQDHRWEAQRASALGKIHLCCAFPRQVAPRSGVVALQRLHWRVHCRCLWWFKTFKALTLHLVQRSMSEWKEWDPCWSVMLSAAPCPPCLLCHPLR